MLHVEHSHVEPGRRIEVAPKRGRETVGNEEVVGHRGSVLDQLPDDRLFALLQLSEAAERAGTEGKRKALLREIFRNDSPYRFGGLPGGYFNHAFGDWIPAFGQPHLTIFPFSHNPYGARSARREKQIGAPLRYEADLREANKGFMSCDKVTPGQLLYPDIHDRVVGFFVNGETVSGQDKAFSGGGTPGQFFENDARIYFRIVN